MNHAARQVVAEAAIAIASIKAAELYVRRTKKALKHLTIDRDTTLELLRHYRRCNQFDLAAIAAKELADIDNDIRALCCRLTYARARNHDNARENTRGMLH